MKKQPRSEGGEEITVQRQEKKSQREQKGEEGQKRGDGGQTDTYRQADIYIHTYIHTSYIHTCDSIFGDKGKWVCKRFAPFCNLVK